MNVPDKNTLLITILVAAGLVAGGKWVYEQSPLELTSGIVTITSTFFGVVLGAYLSVEQYYRQVQRQEAERREAVKVSLAAELWATLDILAGSPNVTVLDPAMFKPIPAVFRPLPVVFANFTPTVVDEAAKSGLFKSDDIANLTQLSNLMKEYTVVSNNLYPRVIEWQIQSNTQNVTPQTLILWDSVYSEAKELTRRKANLAIWCITIIYGFYAQGVEMPTDPFYRSIR